MQNSLLLIIYSIEIVQDHFGKIEILFLTTMYKVRFFYPFSPGILYSGVTFLKKAKQFFSRNNTRGKKSSKGYEEAAKCLFNVEYPLLTFIIES